MPSEVLNVLGAGRAATAIAHLLRAAGHPIGAVITTRRETARRAVQRIGAGRPGVDPSAALEPGSWVLLGTPDHTLAPLARQLAAASGRLADTVVLHLSGALSSAELAPLRERGIAVGSLHPLFSFAEGAEVPPSLSGVGFGIEGDGPAVAAARALVAELGGIALELQAETKPLHHAAAAVASNAVVAVFEAALRLEDAAGISREDALAVLLPLLFSAAQNLQRQRDPARALTGPIERGDVEVVAEHLRAIAQHAPGCLELYRALGRAILQVAAQKGRPDPDRARRLAELLDDRAAADGGDAP